VENNAIIAIDEAYSNHVRENRRTQEWTILRHWQLLEHKTPDKQKK